MKCDVCGVPKPSKAPDSRCYNCGAWFAGIKSALWNNNPKLWYKLRNEGKL